MHFAIRFKAFLARLRKHFKGMIAESTLHGLPNIVESELLLFKLLWASFFVVSLILCILLVVQNFLR